MVDDNLTPPAAASPHVVVLVHGIRTRAPWYFAVRDELIKHGFTAALANYGRFDLIRFVAPIPFFKAWAAAHVERDIRDAMLQHNVKAVSVIAHSFGTFVIAWILRKRFDITFRHIIFCGSVVKFEFPFEQHPRFSVPLINEVGTRDIWPILAESVTWGYGSTGAFGFSRPRVYDRFHRGVSHSAFLNSRFCEDWWIPVLRGEPPQPHDEPESPPWWLRLLSVIHFKYVTLVVITLSIYAATCLAPLRSVTIVPKQYFVGEEIARLVSEAAKRPSVWCGDLLSRRRYMSTTGITSAVNSLVVCRTTIDITYRDPTMALQIIASKVPCLDVSGVELRRLEVDVNRNLAREVKTRDGQSLWLCGCDDTDTSEVLRTRNR